MIGREQIQYDGANIWIRAFQFVFKLFGKLPYSIVVHFDLHVTALDVTPRNIECTLTSNSIKTLEQKIGIGCRRHTHTARCLLVRVAFLSFFSVMDKYDGEVVFNSELLKAIHLHVVTLIHILTVIFSRRTNEKERIDYDERRVGMSLLEQL